MSRKRVSNQRAGKRERIRQRKALARRSASALGVGSKWWVAVLAIVIVAGLGAYGWSRYASDALIGRSANVAFVAVTPSLPEQLDPELADLIARQVATVNADPSDVDGHATLGAIYSANELVQEARKCFENAARLGPRDPLWPYRAAVARARSGDFEGALGEYVRLADLYPGFAPLQFRLGDALAEAGEFAAAAAAFERAVALKPSLPEPYVGLADVRIRQRDFAAAAPLLERARTLDPGYRMVNYLLGQAYRAMGRREEAAREMSLGIEAEKRYLPDAVSSQFARYLVGLSAQFSESGALMDAGRYEAAAKILSQALAAYPNNADVMNNLSVAYLRLRRYEDALRVLHRARRVDPSAFPTYINIVECLLALNRSEEAIPYGEKAAELAPRVGQAHFARARAFVGAGRHEEAREALRDTLSFDARNPEAYLLLGEVCLRLGLNAEARDNLASAAKRMPRLLRAHVALTDACVRLGLYDEASTALDAARQLAPQHPAVVALDERIATRGF